MTDYRATADEAARWVARMDGGDWGEADEAELKGWLSADPTRSGALLQAQAFWASLDRSDAGAISAPALNDNRFSRRTLFAGAAAAAASISLMGSWFLTSGWQRYDTRVGEIRRVPLADGSIATINTASKVDVKFTEDRRRILLEEGEVWFQVAKARTRPFIVEAGRIRVVAIGTAFSVRRKTDGAEIMVTEGVIQAWAAGADGHKVTLRAGQRAFVADNAAIVPGPAEPSSVDRALAWRNGKIDLVGESLSAAASEFNRYNEVQIIIADPALGAERFDGVFRIDDPEGFATAVERSLDVPVKREGPKVLRIG